MEVLVMIGQLILSLSILIVLHELGHFVPAKLFGTRVEKFYLFFDPYFELFKKQIGETEYGIGWLPLGGYVKISGMIDESFDTEQMEAEPQPWEFRSKPAWQRLIIMLGGVTVNFILGFFIYSMILWHWGEEFLPIENAKYGIYTDELGQELGLENGDVVWAVGDKKLERLSPGDVRIEIIINGAKTIEVERNGQRKVLTVPDTTISKLSEYDNNRFSLFEPRMPFVIDRFSEESPAEEIGIKKEDKIISLNGKETPFFNDFSQQIRGDSRKIVEEFEQNREKGFMAWLKGIFGKKQKADLKREVLVAIERTENGQLDTLDFKLETTANGLIGAGPKSLETDFKKYSFGGSFPAGYAKGVDFLDKQITAFGKMFTGEIKATESLGSFFTIGQQFGGEWIWRRFWELTAALSLILAFINLLPIPALDGGHVMFLLYELISGRKPSDKFLEYATMIGFVLLIGLMIFAVGNDIRRVFF